MPRRQRSRFAGFRWAVAAVLIFITAANAQNETVSVEDAAAELESRAEQSRIELNNTLGRIETEKVPLNNLLDTLESDFRAAQAEYEEVLNVKNARVVDVSTLQTQILNKEKQNEYLVSQLDEYIKGFEARLSPGDEQRFSEPIAQSKSDAINSNLTQREKFAARLDVVDLALNRMEESIGGASYGGVTVDESGNKADGKFLQFGPLLYFAGPGAPHTGLVQKAPGEPDPFVIPAAEENHSALQQLAESGEGAIPLDVTRGEAIKMEEASKSLVETIKAGGAVMYPLVGLGIISIIIALVKWIQLNLVQRIGPKKFNKMMVCLVNNEEEKARNIARKVKGPIGKMLEAGIENHEEPRDLVEEVMYEKVLFARARLNSFIPFIKITAAAAPLMGLLGTVSGMINTFQAIKVKGAGDASSFSGGISEALITTQWGLIVAIPALLLSAFLARKAKGILDDMEKLGISFLNSLPDSTDPSSIAPEPPTSSPKKEGTKVKEIKDEEKDAGGDLELGLEPT
ncbi:MAG: MotA/TolQ/ExbB proton channel family protein [Verrucomicrobiota bacterium]